MLYLPFFFDGGDLWPAGEEKEHTGQIICPGCL